jgi:4-hydroxy-tetrahydrodipicolinate reductase
MSDTAIQYGVGPIGSRIVETAVDRGYQFVGAVDVDPGKVGADLGRVAGLAEPLGVEVTDDATAALAAEPDVVFHSTASSIGTVEPQLVEAMAAGADVVSTTEELAHPWLAHREIAERLDDAAREHGVTCLGTGINPGFAMDTLPAVLTAPCRSVEAVRVEWV